MFCNKCGNEIKEGEKFCAKCGNNVKKSRIKNLSIGKKVLLIMFLITLIMFIIAFGIYEYNSNNNVLDNDKQSNNVNNIEESIQTSISAETKANIKKLYSRVSGYDSSKIVKALYWKTDNGTPSLLIAYQDIDRNGMYITINGTHLDKSYGDEESLANIDRTDNARFKRILFFYI